MFSGVALLAPIFVLSQAPTLAWAKKQGQASSATGPHKLEVAVNFGIDKDGDVYTSMNKYGGPADTGSISKYSAAGNLIWTRVCEENFVHKAVKLIDLRTDSAGNVFVLGQTPNYEDKQMMIIQKYNRNGTRVWEKIEQDPQIEYTPKKLMIDNSGNLVIGGEIGFPYGPNGGFLQYQLFLAKFSKQSGSRFWMDISYDSDYLTDLSVDPSGNPVAIGRTLGPGGGGHGAVLVIKYSSLGYFYWKHVFYPHTGITTSGHEVKTDAAGNVYISTTFYHGINASHDYAVTKYSSSGTQQWSKEFANESDEELDPKMIVAPDGNVYAALTAGYPSGTHDDRDLLVKKLAPTGALLWARSYSSGELAIENAFDMQLDQQGNLYISGVTKKRDYGPGSNSEQAYQRKVLALKYNSLGRRLWVINSAGELDSDFPSAQKLALFHPESSDPTLYVFGQTYFRNPPTISVDDILLCKYVPAATLKNSSVVASAMELVSEKGFKVSSFPNPFHTTSTISFDLPYAANVDLTIYDVAGRQVTRLVSKQLPSGTHNVLFDASRYSGQQFYYTLSALSEKGNFKETKSVLLIK